MNRPIDPKERIPEIDALRGLAIFGMLLVNTGSLGGYWRFPHRWTGTLDRITVDLISSLAEDKFSTLFAFLFGLGFAIQICRAEARGTRFVPLFLRRLVGLLLIGLLALVFVAPVLVLLTYAVLGFLLLLFRTCRPETLLRVAFVCMLIPAFSEVVMVATSPRLEQQTAAERKEQAEERTRLREESIRIQTEGTYADLMVWRTRFAISIYSRPSHDINLLGKVFPIFLLGLWVGRRRLFEQLSAQLFFVRKVFWWSMGIGFGGTLASLALQDWFDLGRPQVTGPLATLFWNFGRTGLSLCYATGLVLLIQRQYWKRRLAPLASAGRIALSNYLFQLVVLSIVFSAYGLGLYGRIGPALGVAVTLLIFGVQVLLSIWWLRRFRFGPAEWTWRAFTYGKLPPNRLSVPTSDAS